MATNTLHTFAAFSGVLSLAVATNVPAAPPTPDPTQTVKVETLHDFNGADGAYPGGTLVKRSPGEFYGVVGNGGYYGNGTIFRITKNGSFKLLYRLNGDTDGSQPTGLWLQHEDLYGTAALGGAIGYGTVFKLTPAGKFSVIHSFNGLDGDEVGGAVAPFGDGWLGASGFGGTNPIGGTLYELSPNGTTAVVYNFQGGVDESQPNGVIRGRDGNYYGTTSGYYVGSGSPSGTIWRLTSGGVLATLHSFTGGDDGGGPRGVPTQATDGYFYGTASTGGVGGCGVIYRFSTASDFVVMHSFDCNTEGDFPIAPLTEGKDGYLYGTTALGTPSGYGALFRMSKSGAFTVLYSFMGSTDGGQVSAGLVEDHEGEFYGVAGVGGANSYGTVFRFTVK